MTIKDLTAFLTPDLVLDHHGKQYAAPPPTVEVGLQLSALLASGVVAEAAARSDGSAVSALDALSEKQKAALEAVREKDLGELTLGPAYQQMLNDGMPGPHMDMYALYAFYYWVVGEAAADGIIEQTHGTKDPKGDAGPKPSKNGRRLGSANRTKTVSTATT